jgi:hypothetical protein
MSYWLVMKQEGEGRDYMIGCGTRVVDLHITDLDTANLNAIQELDGIGVGYSREHQLSQAFIVSMVQDVMPLVNRLKDQYEQQARDEERAIKKAQLERLKRELGEE